MITVYTQDNCPKCKILKKKLDGKNIEYVECNDIDIMLTKGVESVPVIELDGNMFDYANAVKWVNEV